MNIYVSLNKLTNYIENNLYDNITNKKLSTLTGINFYSLNNAFSLITGYTIKEYIRMRRLSNSFILLKTKSVTEVSFMCGYNCTEAFARSFKKLHGFNPSLAKTTQNFKFFPKISFKENDNNIHDINITTKTLPSLTLFANEINLNKGEQDKIHNFWVNQNESYTAIKKADIKYGVVDCNNGKLTYFVALTKRFDKTNKKIVIPAGKYISLKYHSYKTLDFSKLCEDLKNEYSDLENSLDIEIYRNGEIELLYKIKKLGTVSEI